MVTRCGWCGDDPLYMDYHDHEWGTPLHDDQQWFEFLTLEGAQAGLSWITVLRKRDAFRLAFDQLDPHIVAQYDEAKMQTLLQNTAIIRNKLKIKSAITNAQRFLEIQSEFNSFDAYIWRFVDGQTIQNAWRSLAEVPDYTPESEAMSKDLKKRGFKFVGPTICYALMQATGMVNDHVIDCFRYADLQDV